MTMTRMSIIMWLKVNNRGRMMRRRGQWGHHTYRHRRYDRRGRGTGVAGRGRGTYFFRYGFIFDLYILAWGVKQLHTTRAHTLVHSFILTIANVCTCKYS